MADSVEQKIPPANATDTVEDPAAAQAAAEEGNKLHDMRVKEGLTQ